MDTEIVVLNQGEERNSAQELTDDLIAIITVFSGRLYGSRSNKNKKIIEESKRYSHTIRGDGADEQIEENDSDGFNQLNDDQQMFAENLFTAYMETYNLLSPIACSINSYGRSAEKIRDDLRKQKQVLKDITTHVAKVTGSLFLMECFHPGYGQWLCILQ